MRILFIITVLLVTFPGQSQEKTYTIVFLNKKPDAHEIDKETQTKLFEGHMANMDRLAQEGKLLAAGPFEGGGGIFIMNTTSMAKAESWIATDPAVQAKRWNVEILPFTPRSGSVCPVKDIKMVTYTFVRFNAVVDKFTASNFPSLIRQHEKYVKKITAPMQVVSEGIFGPNEGGILIVKEELASDAFSQDPGVQQGLLDVDVKRLYIAEGSFCEN